MRNENVPTGQDMPNNIGQEQMQPNPMPAPNQAQSIQNPNSFAPNPPPIQRPMNGENIDVSQYKTPEGTYKCNECPGNKAFKYPGKLEVHIKAVHMKLKEFSCPNCSFETAYSFELSRHQRQSACAQNNALGNRQPNLPMQVGQQPPQPMHIGQNQPQMNTGQQPPQPMHMDQNQPQLLYTGPHPPYQMLPEQIPQQPMPPDQAQ